MAAPTTTSRFFINKGNGTGWSIFTNGANLLAKVECATTDAMATYVFTLDGKWHHVAFTFDDAGDRMVRLYLDGVLVATSAAGVGAIAADAASSLYLGSFDTGVSSFLGAIGWCRISNSIRYAANFKPSRAFPGIDGNTLAQWNMVESTGNTVDNAEGTAARDGTITAGTWQPQWYSEGTPVIPTSVQGSATYVATITAAATVNDLHASDFTIEGWFRVPKTGVIQHLCYKGTIGTNGWRLRILANGTLEGNVMCATPQTIASAARYDDNRWHYFKMVYDFTADRKIRLYVDNVADGVSAATAGAIVSDAAVNGFVSHAAQGLTGGHGWVTWSNTPRAAGMFSRSVPRAVDANTMARWVATVGALAVLTDDSGNANNGAMAGTYS
jgi:hypothetical protein